MTVALVLHRADGAPVSTSFRRAAFGKDDPFARHREIAWEGPGSMIAGRTSFIGELEVASFPHIETIVVVEGELTLTAAGAAPLVLGPQAGAVIGCGTALRIQAASRVRFVVLRGRLRETDQARPRPAARRRRLQAVRLRRRRRCCWARPRNAAATTSSPTTARSTSRAPGIRHRTTGSSVRIASTSSCICWPAACGSQRPMAACCRWAPAMRCSCPRAHRSDGKAAIAWRSSTWSKASRPEPTSEIHHVPSAAPHQHFAHAAGLG